MAKRGKSGSSLLKGLFLLGIPGLAVILVVHALTSKSEPKPGAFSALESDPASGSVLYEVPKKVSLQALAEDLEAKGLIRNAWVFRTFLRLSGQDKKIRAGYYHVK